MDFITFGLGELGQPTYRAADERYQPLGVFLTVEVGTMPTLGLDLLWLVDDVVRGRQPSTEWDGEGFLVTFTPAGVTMQNLFLDWQRGEYPLGRVREAAESYWTFIVGVAGRPQVDKELLMWEERWKQPHPYRGRAVGL